jgi:anti-sigma B factor antagonist
MSTSTLTLASHETQPNGPKVVELNGNLNLETVAGFNRELREESAPALLLDFTNVQWLDSAGVGAMVQLLVRRAKTGQGLAIAGLSPRNRAVLEVAQVLKLFNVFQSADDATKIFAATGKFA